jgi:hypothetical protein
MRSMATNAFQMRNSVGLSKAVYCRTLASASSGRMKNCRPALERERLGHRVQLRLREIPLCLRENLLDLLEQSCPRWQKLRPITISFS